MNILYLYADNEKEWNCSEWRCVMPVRAINASGKASAKMIALSDWAMCTPGANILSRNADLIVLQRNAISKAITEIERWKAEGKTIVVDLDDDYHTMPPSIRSYPFWKNGILKQDSELVQLKYTPLEQLEWAVKLVDGITSPSRLILEDWKKRKNIKGWWIPNLIEPSEYDPARHTPADNLIIGWGGSATHYESFHESGCVTALRRIVERRKAIVHICGSGLSTYRDLRIRPPKARLIEHVSHAEWPALLSTFDIGIAPLYGAYDQRRSWLKGAEYSVMHIPWLASEGTPYQDLFDMGLGIPVKNQGRYWEEALIYAVDHFSEIKEKAIQSPMVEKLTWPQQVDTILATYQEIIDGNPPPPSPDNGASLPVDMDTDAPKDQARVEFPLDVSGYSGPDFKTPLEGG